MSLSKGPQLQESHPDETVLGRQALPWPLQADWVGGQVPTRAFG